MALFAAEDEAAGLESEDAAFVAGFESDADFFGAESPVELAAGFELSLVELVDSFAGAESPLSALAADLYPSLR